jgi:hypothetical protein
MTYASGDAASWRDIADQLTPDQVAHMESLQPQFEDKPDALLFLARHEAAENLRSSVMFGHIKPPPDSKWCFRWQQDDDAVWFREFWGEETHLEGASILIAVTGRQFNDGHCETTGVTIAGQAINKLTAAQARELARLLVDAADEIERR